MSTISASYEHIRASLMKWNAFLLLQAVMGPNSTVQSSSQARESFVVIKCLMDSTLCMLFVYKLDMVNVNLGLERISRSKQHLLLVCLGLVCLVPIFDGSAREWVKAIKQVGLTVAMDSNSRSCDKLATYLTEPIHVSKGDSVIAAFLLKETNISYGINFHHVINASDHIYGVISLASKFQNNDIVLWDVLGKVGLFRLRGHRDRLRGHRDQEIVETHVADKKDTIEDAIMTMEDENEDY
ncbi:probable UDP-3-O-acyl-N-acetylglucosamine deacetylase 2 [Tanacetum coccineum]